MLIFLFWTALGFLGGVFLATFFEWTLHRFIMHKPTFGFRYPFERHALIHHQLFRADHTYHAKDIKDAKLIPMAWWNGPVLVALCASPLMVASIIFQRWGLLCGGALAISIYFTAYEYIHWCMHLPKRRHVERSGIFFRLNGHHLLHHRYMHKNFNVVLPLADLLLGTLQLRSKVHFQQAQGPSVPNVQPKTRKLNPEEASPSLAT